MTTSTLSPKTARLELDRIEQQMMGADPRKILAWCVSNIPTGLVLSSAFSIDDLVITDILYRGLKPTTPVPVIFLDTLHHFPETLELVEAAQKIYNLDLKVYQPDVISKQAFAIKYGSALWEKDLNLFHYLTKTVPLEQALTALNAIAWISGSCRNNEQVFSWDKQGRLQINPLAYWRRVESWAYAYEYDLIYNPLYDDGHSEIGENLST